MTGRLLQKLVVPSGPLLSIALIGMLVLSGSLYYRAVKIQRFLEPALALSQPRNEFGESISAILHRELDPEQIKGVGYKAGAILVNESLLFRKNGKLRTDAGPLMKKLSNVIHLILDDDLLRSHIDLIVINSKYLISDDPRATTKARWAAQRKSEILLSAMYQSEPEIENDFGTYFTPGSIAASKLKKGLGWIEIRIIPSEQLHIDVLQRLRKYVH